MVHGLCGAQPLQVYLQSFHSYCSLVCKDLQEMVFCWFLYFTDGQGVVEVPKRFGGSFTLGDFAIAWMGGRITRAMAIKMVDDMDCTKAASKARSIRNWELH